MKRCALHLLCGCLLLVAAAGCTGTRTGEELPPIEIPPQPEGPVLLADVEDFDPSLYPEDPPPPPPPIEHEVPVELMESRADAGVVLTIDGFRVQIYSSIDQQEALRRERSAHGWLDAQIPDSLHAGLQGPPSPVYNIYQQPYYRVRLGNFETREEAEIALTQIKRRFSRAFVVPDQVRIVRGGKPE